MSGNVWGVTDAIKSDVAGIKVAVARLEERAAARDTKIDLIASRMEAMESRVQKLDLKLAGAMGGVLLIAWGLQLLAPMI
tara:strand:+ start:1098 stop:1337 length:240 start_codon:yes stop_codon:yes gene_type:complete